ncbi:hypothetical protein OGAPHI_006733 [Ogataea philodendri]|uniref:Uncharacterized protein n=1 Tax=Ogataea philodendri TaxID=1378263 RepID=A0A9P8T160_9ASCO|nr:uncharacterized protein OGAPHI_006733 [Ogataea philodendri]KAH3661326.1 hypothetical protein OGAPHI_006733 [Ogataea philodendri]
MAGDYREVPTFDPVQHLAFTSSKLPKPVSIQTLQIDPDSQSLQLVGEGSFLLFSQECIDLLRHEFQTYLSSLDPATRSKSAFVSPKLHDCASILPFTYQAFTHPETARAISSISGFGLKVCMGYEIAHFARPNAGDFKQLLLRKHSVAYPYICLVHLSSADALPSGHALVLEGRVTENMASNQLLEQPDLNIVLCATLQPEDVIDYEDSRFLRHFSYANGQKLIGDSVAPRVSTYAEFDNFEAYQIRLDRLYRDRGVDAKKVG